MRNHAETKPATRSASPRAFRNIKPKGRSNSPSASGASGLKRLPGRELVLVANAAKRAPKSMSDISLLSDADFVEARPVAPEEQHIGLFSSHDEDELAWQRAYDAARQAAARRHAQVNRERAQKLRRWRNVLSFGAAGSLSVMIGIGASLVAYDLRMGNISAPEWFTALVPAKPDAPPDQPAVKLAAPEPAPATAPALDDTQTASLPPSPQAVKTIAMAHLDVQDVEGAALQYIPLSITAEPSGPDEKLAVRLSGLPGDAMLTSGRKLGDGTWLLEDGEEEKVKLVLPSLTSGKLALGVEALMMPSGEEATPMKEMTVSISPAKADMTVVPVADGMARQTRFDKGGPISLQLGPDPVPMRLAEASPQSLPDAVAPPDEILPQPAAGIAARGDAALKTGDVAGARSFYLRAYEQGNRLAAAGVARSYDPAVFRQLKVRGLKPDAAKAREWYAKAAAAGDAEAAKRADALQAAN